MSNWTDLPEDILILIGSNLFDKDFLSFGQVCKAWNAAASIGSPDHRVRTSACLMFYQRSTRRWNFFRYDGFFSMQFKPEMCNAQILCSKHKWLLMSRNSCDLFFFNPLKNESFQVPEPLEGFATFSFLNPPTSSDCYIVCFGHTQSPYSGYGVKIGILEISSLQLPKDQWNMYEFNCEKLFVSSPCTPILHRGLLYFLEVNGNVATFNIEERSNWTSYKNCLSPTRLRRKLKQHFMIKHEETIFGVFVVCDGKRVRVYKLLEPDMKWELVKDLGDKMFFVSRAASFAVKAPLKSMANNIYFTKLYGDSGIFYSLTTQMYHSFDGGYNNQNCYGLRELPFAAWTTPT